VRLFPETDVDLMVEQQPLLLVEDIEAALAELNRCVLLAMTLNVGVRQHATARQRVGLRSVIYVRWYQQVQAGAGLCRRSTPYRRCDITLTCW